MDQHLTESTGFTGLRTLVRVDGRVKTKQPGVLGE